MRLLFRSIFEAARTIAIVVVIAFLIRVILLQPFYVEGHSMEPNFQNAEYLLVNKVSYTWREPERGDVIVFRFPNDPRINFIKRIIGLPGDAIVIKEGRVFVNNVALVEPYLGQTTKTFVTSDPNETFNYRVKEREFFVMGDNRGNSLDSRSWGAVPRLNVVGRAWVVIWPLSDFGLVTHPRLLVGQQGPQPGLTSLRP